MLGRDSFYLEISVVGMGRHFILNELHVHGMVHVGGKKLCKFQTPIN